MCVYVCFVNFVICCRDFLIDMFAKVKTELWKTKWKKILAQHRCQFLLWKESISANPWFCVWNWTKWCDKRRRRRAPWRRARGGELRSRVEPSRGNDTWNGGQGRRVRSTLAATTTLWPSRSSRPAKSELCRAKCRLMSRRVKVASKIPPDRRAGRPFWPILVTFTGKSARKIWDSIYKDHGSSLQSGDKEGERERGEVFSARESPGGLEVDFVGTLGSRGIALDRWCCRVANGFVRRSSRALLERGGVFGGWQPQLTRGLLFRFFFL